MHVYFVSTMYPRPAAPYRGVFIRNMLGALTRLEHTSVSAWVPPGKLPQGVESVTTKLEADWLGKMVDQGGISHLMRSHNLASLMAPIKLLRSLRRGYVRTPDVDIYHINWLQCALPLPSNGKPALITVLGNDLKLLRLPGIRRLLRRVMRGRNVAICPNAEWMVPELESAFGDVASIQPVSFGIDPIWYQITRSTPPTQVKKWLVVARLTHDKMGPLFEWSRDLFKDTSRELHLFGPMEQDVTVPDWVHYHGPASPDQLAQEWFPQAIGLITLSRHAEGRPQVMLEAMAAGLPIVASRMPAHGTVVADGETGWLCDSPSTYEQALVALEDPHTNRTFGARARSKAASELGTWDDCALRYSNIHARLLESKA